MKRIAIAFVVVIVFLSCAVLALDVPGITPLDFQVGPSSPEVHWFWSMLASDTVVKLLLAALAWIISGVVGFLKWKGSRYEQCLMFLEAGVRTTYEEYVRAIKHATENGGKLTEDQRQEAVRRAIEYAKIYAKEAGFDLGKSIVKQALPVLVDAIVRKIKGEAALSKSPLSPPSLPDLPPSQCFATN